MKLTEKDIGRSVMLNINSTFYSINGNNNPRNVLGTIISIDERYYYPIRVKWNNNTFNCYKLKDLELINGNYEIY